MSKKCALLAVVIMVTLLTGCGVSYKAIDFSPGNVVATNRHPNLLSINVIGAVDGFNSAFAESLKTAIIESGVFSKIVETGTDDYHLDVAFVEFGGNNIGFAMSTTIKTHLRLTKVKNDKIVWEDDILTSASAGATEAFAGWTRKKLADTRAASETIRITVEKLSKVEL